METTTADLTKEEIEQFVADWYHNLDIHAPLEEMLEMIVDEGSEFRFPEVTSHGKDEFSEWYHRVTNTFFDEIHTTLELHIEPNGPEGKVQLVTHWQTSIWNPPAAKSERLDFHAGQTWRVERSARTGKVVIQLYGVDSFVPVGDLRGL